MDSKTRAAFINSSLARSASFGLDPNSRSLPRISEADQVKLTASITKSARYIRSLYSGFFDSIDKAFASYGAVLLFLNNERKVISIFGDKSLMNALSARGLTYGTDFSEEQIGTNAVVLANEAKEYFLLTGSEHYIRAFEGYSSLSSPVIRNEVGGEYNLLAIIRGTDMSSGIIKLMQNLLESYAFVLNWESSPVPATITHFLNGYLAKNHIAYLLVDDKDRVAHISDTLLTLYKRDRESVVGELVSDFMPEISSHLKNLRSGRLLDTEECRFYVSGKRQEVFISGMNLVYAGKHFIAVTLESKEYLSKKVNAAFGNGTYLTLDNLVGPGILMQRLRNIVRKAADSKANVLILGESGTGKEIIAQALHSHSRRRGQPFVSLNCAAIPKDLIGSELFGYAEGAFTGAKKGGAPGKFQMADGGTLFLDEIGDMPLDMQGVLLRVLEEKTVTPLGSSKSRKVDVRVIAATNQNLSELVEQNKFRRDLYYRLDVIAIETVPLRSHPEDIPAIAEYFLDEFALPYGRSKYRVSPHLMRVFEAYSWPGNVRELKNTLEYMTEVSDRRELDVEDLPARFSIEADLSVSEETVGSVSSVSEEPQSYKDYEKEQIVSLLKKYHGNKSLVARELHMSRQTLYTHMKRFDIPL